MKKLFHVQQATGTSYPVMATLEDAKLRAWGTSYNTGMTAFLYDRDQNLIGKTVLDKEASRGQGKAVWRFKAV